VSGNGRFYISWLNFMFGFSVPASGGEERDFCADPVQHHNFDGEMV
jgi:hypothetical protein